jgi:hypothetical protein
MMVLKQERSYEQMIKLSPGTSVDIGDDQVSVPERPLGERMDHV